MTRSWPLLSVRVTSLEEVEEVGQWIIGHIGIGTAMLQCPTEGLPAKVASASRSVKVAAVCQRCGGRRLGHSHGVAFFVVANAGTIMRGVLFRLTSAHYRRDRRQCDGKEQINQALHRSPSHFRLKISHLAY